MSVVTGLMNILALTAPHTSAQVAFRNSQHRFHNIMDKGLGLAIESGLVFEPSDFATLAAWQNVYHIFGERFYTLAVKVNNVSACQSYEKYAQRKPFIYKGRRLVVGSFITWQDCYYHVTSFNKQGMIILQESYYVETKYCVKHTFRLSYESFHKGLKAQFAP